MKAWPPGLNGPENDAQVKPGTNLFRRKLESGRTEVRRFGSGAPDVVTLSFYFSETDIETFTVWYDWDLNLGSNWFTADWLSIIGYTSHAARFLGHPKYTGKRGEEWRVSATVIVQKTAWVFSDDTTWPSMRI